jgi:hypothetical protein
MVIINFVIQRNKLNMTEQCIHIIYFIRVLTLCNMNKLFKVAFIVRLQLLSVLMYTINIPICVSYLFVGMGVRV